MISREDTLKVASLLEQAGAQGIWQARQGYVCSAREMCATAAMYNVLTGIVPWDWDYEYTPEQVADELQSVLGIDFSAFSRGASFLGRTITMNDYGVSFLEIAAILRREAEAC